MHRIATIGIALVLAGLTSAPTVAQPVDDPEAVLGSLNNACQQGNLGACVRFGIIIGSHPRSRAKLARLHPEWFWWNQ